MYVEICCNICTFFYYQVSVFDGTYDIRTPQTDFTVITAQDDEDRPMRSYTLGELKPSAFYQVEVRARNDNTFGNTLRLEQNSGYFTGDI